VIVEEIRLLMRCGILDKYNTHDRNYMLKRLEYTEKELKDKMKSPVNTAKMNPMDILVGAMMNPDKHIEGMEAEGQQQLVDSNVLPTEMRSEDREKLELLGVQFLEIVPDDYLFTYVTLPEGWKVIPTEHNMWTTLVDGKGKEIASIFYKAAFYDRKAFLLSLKEEV